MKTAIEFLDEIKARNNGLSDYAIAKRLGVTRSCISFYRTGRSCFDDETAEKVAEELGVNPVYVMACAHAERAKVPSIKSHWMEAAERFAAALLLAICVTVTTTQHADAATFISKINALQTIHYTKCA